MSTEDSHHEDERPRPARFSIFGQIQPRSFSSKNHLVSVKGEDCDYNHHADERYDDEDEEHQSDADDQPLDFSSKKLELSPTAQITASIGLHHHHHNHPTNGSGGDSNRRYSGGVTNNTPYCHSSESGISDLCSNSPQSEDGVNTSTARAIKRESPCSPEPNPYGLSQASVRGDASPLPQNALSALYGPLAVLQAGRAVLQAASTGSPISSGATGATTPTGIDPALSAATTQLLTNLAAVTNGAGKSGKNTRPFKAYPRDPMSLPLGLYGLPTAGNVGEETTITTASNEAYAEFRRQMLSQVNATKTKRKTNSRPNSVNEDDGHCNGIRHGSSSRDGIPETTIRGTVSVTDLRLVNGNDEDSNDDSVCNESLLAPSKSPAVHNDMLPLTSSSTSPLNAVAATSNDMLNGLKRSGSSNGSSGKKRQRNGDEIKDEAYWERRRKNNEAAKRSRDARRAKEDEIAIRAAFLEQENLKLRFELANLKNETAKLRCMIYNS